MSNKMNSFHITDVIYDAEAKSLTYKFINEVGECKRVGFGYTTDEEIAADFQKTIGKHFAKT